MSYKEEVINHLNKFNVKPPTVKLYSIKLNQLNNDLGITYKDSFNDFNKIFNYIKNFSTDNQLAFLNSIIFILDSYNKKLIQNLENSNNKLIKIYKDKRIELNKIKSQKYDNNIKPDNFIYYDKLFNLYTKPDFSEELKIVLNRMILYIAIRYPMRNELGNIEIARKKADMNNPNTNYLYITTKNMWFYMNKFKNISSMGKMIILVEKEDQPVIREYLKFLKHNKIDSKRLLLTYYGGVNEFSTNDLFGSKLKTLLSYNFPKNNLTMNNIRRAYETKLINSDAYKSMDNKEKNLKHNRLLHRMGSAHENYNMV